MKTDDAGGFISNPAQMEPVDDLMHEAIAERVFPGGVLLVYAGGETVFHKAYGRADLSTRALVKTKTIFDLASLTKPLATTIAVMRLIQEGRLDLRRKIGEIIPDLGRTEKGEIEIRHLLAHNSGLPDYRPYYLELQELETEQRRPALHTLLREEPLVSDIGTETRYSDIGFMLLQWVIETITHTGLDEFVESAGYAPLHINDLFFVPAARPLSGENIAATEQCPWRKALLKGVVHDENAYVLGGVAGHAGLFGTADAVCRLLAALLDAYHGRSVGDLFPPAVVRTFLCPQPDSDRALGFDMPSPVNSSCGEYFHRESTFGHLGFTGTSFWMDVRESIIVVLLTNRIHPSRGNHKIREFRPKLHNTVIRAIRKDD